jgi:GT2 family glycosyltransferase
VTIAGLRASVVIPVFNRGDLLREVLAGLARQTLPPETFEILVCDDGSTTSLDHVIEEFRDALPRLRHVRQPNQGPATARNLGIVHAVGDVIVFLDSDVLPEPELVAGLTTALVTNADWQGAEARLEPVGGDESLLWDAPRSSTGGHYHTAAIAYRRSVLQAVGGLDEGFSHAACEDVELAVQVLQHGPIGFVPDAVAYHPRRRRTVLSCWNARRHWRYVKILACRHGFLGFPTHRTRWPRLRTALAATVTLPLARARRALAALPRVPGKSVQLLALVVVDWAAGISMVPAILFEPVPPRRCRTIPDPDARETTGA